MGRISARAARRRKREELIVKVTAAMCAVALIYLMVCPVIFRAIEVDFVAPAIMNAQGMDTGPKTDGFTYVKMILLYAASATLAALFVWRVLLAPDDPVAQASAEATTRASSQAPPPARRPRLSARLAPYAAEILLAALSAALFASAFASDYMPVSLHGNITMHDGALPHICYALLFLLGYRVFSRVDRPWLFAIPPCFAACVNAALSLSAFFDFNAAFVNSPVVLFFLGVPSGSRFVSGATFASTFGNVNYLSGFGGAFFAMAFAYLMFCGGEGRRGLLKKAFWLAMTGVAFAIVVSSLSSSGFFTVVVAAPIIATVALISRFDWRRLALLGLALAVCVAVYAPLAARNPKVREETFGFFGAMVSSVAPPAAAVPSVYITQPAAITPPAARAFSAASAASAVSVASAASAAPALTAAPAALAMPPAFAARVSPPHIPEAAIGPGTGRLYIWKETVKLALRRPVFGYGMDTIAYAFPQYDVNKVSGLGSYGVFVTKPHSIYVGYAYGAGIPALLAFLALAALTLWRFIDYFAACRRARSSPTDYTVAFMASWGAYLVQGLVNDDLIATSSIWRIIGGMALGLAVAPRESKKARAEVSA